MNRRKKSVLDGTDRDILRLLYRRGPMVGRQIALQVQLSPAAVALRLRSLEVQGILRSSMTSQQRVFRRGIGTKRRKVISPRSIAWQIDFVS